MRNAKRPILRGFVVGAAVLILIAAGAWKSLGIRPAFHSKIDSLPPEKRRAEARRFWAQSTQLRNDIANEPQWDAVFSDEEVNAWLSEDLVNYFSDQIPPGVSDPRVAFEPGKVVMAFHYEHPPLNTYITFTAKVHVPEENVIALELESVKAGLVPVSADRVFDRLIEHARVRGIEIDWKTEGGVKTAYMRYKAHGNRSDVVLERIVLADGQVRLSGRSDRSRGVVKARLPRLRTLQSAFPIRPTSQPVRPPSFGPVSLRSN